VAFKNRGLAKRTTKRVCDWCSWGAGRRFAAHIIDEGPERDWNALSLCPNCSTVFDEIIRPKLYRALKEWGTTNLPKSWIKDNKISLVVEVDGGGPPP
jgi:hypothetical protein